MNENEIDRLLKSATTNFSRAIYSFIERELVRNIEEIEGRVPNDDEIRRHALCAIFPDGHMEWTWKGGLILKEVSSTGHSFDRKFLTRRSPA